MEVWYTRAAESMAKEYVMRKPFWVCTMTIRASGRSRREVFGPYVSSEWFDLVTVASRAVGLVCHTLSDEAVTVVNMLPARDVLMSTISCSSAILSVEGVGASVCSKGVCSCSKTRGVSCPASGESGEMASLSRDDCNAEADVDVEVIVVVVLRGIKCVDTGYAMWDSWK